jgi:hypothetical protein
MQIKDLVNKSWYSTTGYIKNDDDLKNLESYIKYNLTFLKKFKGIITSINYNYKDPDLRCRNEDLWNKYFDNVVQLECPKNRGYNFGVADLDNQIIDYCKENNIDWVCKSDNDIILDLGLLEKDIEPADFYYINGVGFGGLQAYDFDIEKVIKEDFFPQTNFYFINASKIDYLNDKKYLDETYDYINSLENYSGKVWDYIKDWTCEKFLAQCIERNNLTKFHLISDTKYRILLKHIFDNRVIDCSYKNIMVEGVCHYHFPQQSIILI